MRFRNGRRQAGALVLAAGFVTVAALWAEPGGHELPKPQFNDQGQLIRPEGYREWVYIGTPLTPNELNPPEAPFPDFHNVYIMSSYYHPRDSSSTCCLLDSLEAAPAFRSAADFDCRHAL